MRGNCTPVRFQHIEYLWVTAGTYPLSYSDYQIQTDQRQLMKTKTLAYQALDPVTLDRATSRLDRYSGTQSRVVQSVFYSQYCHQPVAGLVFTTFEYLLEVCC